VALTAKGREGFREEREVMDLTWISVNGRFVETLIE